MTRPGEHCPGSRAVFLGRPGRTVRCPECAATWNWDDTAGTNTYSLVPDHAYRRQP